MGVFVGVGVKVVRQTESPLAPARVVEGSRKITFRYDTPDGAVAESWYGPPREPVTSMSVVIVWIAAVPISTLDAL